MNSLVWADWLWGRKSKPIYLLIAAAILLLVCLGAREIWTQEHRWADIVSGMFYRHDFLHPYLGTADYYDKPLLSYWLIAGIAYITGHLSIWAIRLPSALAGLLAVWSIYRLGESLSDKRLGLLSGWLLLTTFYFIFWARTSSADMLNLAGSLFAVSWYFTKKSQPSFFNYTVFFLILSLTSLCKGLVGAVVALLAVFPDMLLNQEWKKHLRIRVLFALIPAAIVYVLPFLVSSQSGNGYGENGLYEVYRENIVRYLHPFDHQGPIYTYFIFLPIYLLPWTIFFIPALFSLKKRWHDLSANSRWIVYALLLLFIFFTLSGSRRNYYVLPMVPFAILLTADWMLSVWSRYSLILEKLVMSMFVIFIAYFVMLQPLYYAYGGVETFAQTVKNTAVEMQPWQQWRVIMLDTETKISFYLQLPPDIENYSVSGKREYQTLASLTQAWPVLQNKPENVIFISRKMYKPLLQPLFQKYQLIEAQPSLGMRLFSMNDKDLPIAFIPGGK